MFKVFAKGNSDTISVQSLSYISLKVNVYKDSIKISQSATGFIIKYLNKFFLITNKHVVTGINPFSGDSLFDGMVPNKISVWLPRNDKTQWACFVYALFDSTHFPKWLEKKDNELIDVVALPIDQIEDYDFVPIDLDLQFEDVQIIVSQSVNILGFPYGIASTGMNGMLPIWKSGTIASEPEIDIDSQPYFYIDATTVKGMSGSPVIYWSQMFRLNKQNKWVINETSFVKFLGVYSSQFPAIDIGVVWKPEVIKKIIE